MCKSEIFFNLLGLTERETEVPRERILGDFRDMESTDARYVLVRLLSEAGLYPDQIAGMTNRTARGGTAPAGAEHHLADDRNISGTNKETHQNRTLDGARVVEYVCTTVGLVTGTTKYKYNYE